ncbi:unnamed protein product [Closterium sp. NIES-54]
MALSTVATVSFAGSLSQSEPANGQHSSASNSLVSQPLTITYPGARDESASRRSVAVKALFGWGKPKADPPSKSPSKKSPPAKGKVSRASCSTCRGTGGVDCPICKVLRMACRVNLEAVFPFGGWLHHCQGTGKSKTKGNMLERWKCYKCQGFGLVGCPTCGSGGLTPEQRGER